MKTPKIGDELKYSFLNKEYKCKVVGIFNKKLRLQSEDGIILDNVTIKDIENENSRSISNK